MSDSRERALAAVEARRERVDEALEEELPDRHPERLWNASRHLLSAGGKRLRPTVLLLVGEALADVEPLSRDYRAFPTLDGAELDLMTAAVGVEVVHTFTLIHDDIMDDDPLRRGVDSVHRAYDEETAIIAGDTLYSLSFEKLLATGGPPERVVPAVRLLAETCTKICEGQSLDVEFETRTDVVPEEYVEMVDLKTAVLYGAAAAIPARLLGGGDDVVEAIYRFGREVGQAFQIHDDLLDLTTPSETLGKQRGSDLVENKQTIITVHARDQGVDVGGLVDAETPADVTDEEIEAAVAELAAAGSLDYAREMASELVDSGTDHLRSLPDNEAREALADIADYLVTREY